MLPQRVDLFADDPVEEAPQLEAGEIFAGLVVQSSVGRSSSADVYRALDPAGNTGALKVIHPAVARTDVGRARFARECEIVETLHHPHVVDQHGHGEDRRAGAPAGTRPLLWSSMELLGGGTVARLVPRRHRRPDVPLVLEVLRQAAAGLDHVHAMDVVHRDMKPANLMLAGGEPLRVVVTDFGIARFLDESRPLARHGRVQGSLPYAAPEVLQAQHLWPATDVYSLACTAVELLTGRPPYPLATTFAIAHAHISAPPPRVTERRRWLPPALDAVVVRALAKDPADRPATCGAFADAVAAAFASTASVA